MSRFALFIALLFTTGAYTQEIDETALNASSFDSLISLYDNNAADTLLAKRIANIYIAKARLAGDSTKIARGYQRLAFVSSTSDALKYLDTTIALSRNSTHRNFPASGYLFKSYYHYSIEQYESSLQNAILGYQHAKEKGNINQQITALHQMNGVNKLWGDYDSALETEFLTHDLLLANQEHPNFSEYYLAALEGIGNSYVHLNKPDSALVYFKRGMDRALSLQDTISYLAFVSRSGSALYTKGEFNAALDSLQKADVNREAYNNSYLPAYYFYVGSIHYNLGDKEKGIDYLERIDSIYETRHVLYPELPRAYDKLVNYYSEQNNQELQLKYLYKQVLTLRLIDEKRIFINEKTRDDYEIPKLVEEKEQTIADLEEKNQRSARTIWLAFIFLGLSILGLIYYFRRQVLYKKRFENLMQKREAAKITETKTELPKSEISDTIINDILKHVQEFEENKDFLSQDISLSELAKSFQTNSTYLSKVINLKIGKNFSQYINDLRIDYAVEELKLNPIFRKYTIKAIAHECGFKSAESFSKTFYKKHGIYPSYYLKQLQSAKE